MEYKYLKFYPVGVDISEMYVHTYTNGHKHEEAIRKKWFEEWEHYCKENNKNVEERYYVYAYLDPRWKNSIEKYRLGSYLFDSPVFYVGKGMANRFGHHIHEIGNSLKHQVIQLIRKELNRRPIIMKLNDFLTEQEAFDVEQYLIECGGRLNKYDGCLTNKVAGNSKSKWNI